MRKTPRVTTDDLRHLLAESPLLDGHNDLLWEMRVRAGYDFSKLDVAAGVPSLHTDLPRLREGGVGAQIWSVYVPSTLPDGEAVLATLQQLDAWHAMLGRYPAELAKAVTADDVERARAGGRIACLAGMEGGHSIGCSLAALRMMAALGARSMTLTHNESTPWADSATDTARHGGLTRFGVEVVAEMNRIGMLVDLSHVAATTMHAALGATSAPVVFTHSSARALCDHPRNVPDDVLARLPGNGGVCMVTFVPGFVSQEVAEVWLARSAHRARLREALDDADVEAELRSWDDAHPAPAATIAQVADHVDHVRDVAGIAHVGIGGDFDGVDVLPEGLEDVAAYPRLFAELRSRGYSDEDLRAVAGRNVLRVMREAEHVGSDLAAQRGPSLARIEDLDAAAAG